MACYLKDPNWKYEKDKNGQVYFYLQNDNAKIDIISISSEKTTGNVNAEIDTLWKMLKDQIRDIAEFKDSYTDIHAGKYSGKELDFTIKSEKIYGKYLVWNTEDKVYTCSVTADENGLDTVYNALGSLLESFKTYKDLEEEK